MIQNAYQSIQALAELDVDAVKIWAENRGNTNIAIFIDRLKLQPDFVSDKLKYKKSLLLLLHSLQLDQQAIGKINDIVNNSQSLP
jgi:hypothetical protein